MTIVDRQHAALFETKKGRVYKFDAIECMIGSMPDFDIEVIAKYYVADYNAPGELVDAEIATFIISPQIPSPMRANLSSLRLKEQALSLQKEKQGVLFTWQEIQQHLNSN